jgi:hypothetical protein
MHGLHTLQKSLVLYEIFMRTNEDAPLGAPSLGDVAL